MYVLSPDRDTVGCTAGWRGTGEIQTDNDIHMAVTDYAEILEKNGVKVTANRLLIYQAMVGFENTFSLTDLEDVLVTLDKSTIFRTLALFEEHRLIHSIDDGSGSLKYCLCDNLGECSPDETHCHFHCQKCNKTYCLNNIAVPSIRLPAGFAPHSVNYVVQGICPDCKRVR